MKTLAIAVFIYLTLRRLSINEANWLLKEAVFDNSFHQGSFPVMNIMLLKVTVINSLCSLPTCQPDKCQMWKGAQKVYSAQDPEKVSGVAFCVLVFFFVKFEQQTWRTHAV
jgi:hypothetical protein